MNHLHFKLSSFYTHVIFDIEGEFELITPDNIFSFFLSKFFINILDGIFCLLIGIILYSPKIKLKRLIVASILIGLISSTGFILANYYLSSIIVIFTYSVSFFIVPLIIKLTLEIAYFKAFLTYILLLVFELIPGLTLPYILDSIGFSTNKMLSDPLTLFFLNLIVLIMSLIFLPLLKWIKNITYFRKEVSKKHIILIITLIVSNLIIVIINYTFLDNYVAYYNLERDLTNYFITVFLILTNFVITVSISLKISKLGVKEQELENQVFYNNILMNITNDLRRANHNHNNVISSITGIAES